MHRHASLNRIYRLVWSHVHQTWVIASETARGRGKRSNRRLLLATAALATAGLAQAGPIDGQVTSGSGNVHQAGNTTTVTQSSQNLSLTWKSFNTNASETVNFVQPSASAIAINRILDTNPTKFMGKLNADGQVFLINPNGILFGAGSQVNVGGLVASTLDISSNSNGTLNFKGNGTGSIINEGTITTAKGGYVAFVGNIVRNPGSINALGGAVAMGAGSDVTLSFAGNSLVKMQVNRNTLDNLAENGGLIQADGGMVVMSAGAKDALLASVVNNTGIIEARSVQNVNGTIVLGGGDQSTVTNSGTLDASGKSANGKGGTVKVLGENVVLTADSKIDVSGDAGGGTAYIGGNFLGAGPERNAQHTTVAAGSTINADAITTGNGGNVAIWSDDTTRFDGSITARGGSASGNGGQVETSGHKLRIARTASVTTAAVHGKNGNWLLDPDDITIGNTSFWDPSVHIDVDSVALTNALNFGNVTIKTDASTVSCPGISCGSGIPGNGDIIILDIIGGTSDYDAGGTIVQWNTGNNKLTLSAYRNIEFKYTAGYTSPAAGGPQDVGGAIDISSNNDGGQVILHADNSAVGNGTVIFGNPASGMTYLATAPGTDASIEIYYTSPGYTPTDYSQYLIYGDASAISSYMAINLSASIQDKIYDGSTSATLNSITPPSLPSGVTVDASGATASFNDKNAGTNKTVTVDNVELTGINAGDYYLNGLDAQTANISKADLAVTGVTADDKVYDSTTAATLSGAATITAIGVDDVSVTGTGTGTFNDKNADTGKAVTVTGYSLTGDDADNYNIVQPTGVTATITKANLAVTGVTADDKVYDSTTAATLSGTATITAYSGDTVSLAGTGIGTFNDKNADTGKAVTVTGYSLTGGDADNYNIVQPTGVTATITKADLAVTGVTAADKVYDSTAAATLSGTATVTAYSGDTVSLAGTGIGTFNDKNADTGKAVTVTGYSLTGSDADNYNIIQPTGVTATISKADLVLGGLSVSDKVYDGTTSAILSGIASVTIGSDDVSLSGSGVANFNDKNVGTGKAITVSGYAITGADAGNYNLVAPGSLTADITPASLTVSGITANNKVFDGTTNATVNTDGAILAGIIGSDTVTLSSTGNFSDAAVGNDKTVNLTNTFGGADAGNYLIIDQTTTLASITPVPVTPAAPTTSAPAQQIQNIVSQVQSVVLSPQASAQPQSLEASTTVAVSNGNGNDEHTDRSRESNGTFDNGFINTTIGTGSSAPKLQIQNGGMQLPPLATIISE